MSFKEEFDKAVSVDTPYDKVTFKDYNNGMTLSMGQYVGSKYLYHFHTRTLEVSKSSGDGGVTITPFSQLDPEVLEFMRDKLIELGGKPPSLATPPANPFNKLPIDKKPL